MSAAALDVDCPPPPPAASMSRADGKQLASVLDSVSDSLIDFSGSTTNDTSSVLCPSSVTLELAHLQASSQSFKLFDSTARPLRRSARTRRQASQASTSVEKLSKAGPRKMSNYFSHAASSSTPSGSTPCSAPISIPPAQLDPSSSALHRTPPAVTPTPMPDKGAFELHLESTAFRDALPSQASSSSAASPSRSSSSTTHAADLDHSATRHERWAGHNLNDGCAAGSKVLSRSVSSSDLGEGSSRAAAEDPASLPVSVSIPRSTAPSHARKKAADHVPRPRNAFILFRSHAHRQGLVPKELSANHSNISVIISHMWRSLPTEEREMWAKEAQREKDEHALLYPDYKFKPVYRRENVVRRSVRKEGDEEEKNLKIADHILKSHGRDGVQLGEEPNSNIIASSASERKRVRRAESRAKSRNKIAAAAASASSSLEQAHRNRALKVARRAVREVSKSPATTSSAASPADWHCASQQAWDGTQDYVAPALRTVRRSSSVPALADSVNWGKSTYTPAPLSTDGPVIYPASALPQHLKTGFHSYPSPPHQRSATYHEPMHLSAPLHTPMSAYSTVSASGLSSGLAGVPVSRSPQMPISPMTQVHPISASQHSPTFRSQRTDLPRPFTSAGIASAVSNATSALDLSPPTWSNFRDMLASPHVATSYGNARRPSGTGWQSSSRLVNADIGLPVMKPRGSIGQDTNSLSTGPASLRRERMPPRWDSTQKTTDMDEVDALDESDFAAAAKAAQQSLNYQQDSDLQHLLQSESGELGLSQQHTDGPSEAEDFFSQQTLFRAPSMSHSQALSSASQSTRGSAFDWAVYGSNAPDYGPDDLTQVLGADAAFVEMLMAPRASAGGESLSMETDSSPARSQQSLGALSNLIRSSQTLHSAQSADEESELVSVRNDHYRHRHQHQQHLHHVATPLELALGNAPWPSFEDHDHHMHLPSHHHEAQQQPQEYQDALR